MDKGSVTVKFAIRSFACENMCRQTIVPLSKMTFTKEDILIKRIYKGMPAAQLVTTEKMHMYKGKQHHTVLSNPKQVQYQKKVISCER